MVGNATKSPLKFMVTRSVVRAKAANAHPQLTLRLFCEPPRLLC